MLDEGVVADAADIDLAMITGAGWPFWLGGITPYLDRSGRLGAGHRPAVRPAGSGNAAGSRNRRARPADC